MTTELVSWPRQFYEPNGSEPFLFYVVYGNTDPAATLSASRYRCSGIPSGIELNSYGPKSSPEVPGSFREGYLWDRLVKSDGELAEAVEQSERCIVVRGTPTDDSSLDYLRNVVGLLTWLIDTGGCCIYDPQMFEWWSPNAWKTRIFEPADSVPHRHIVILASEDEIPDTTWYHTRGMRKFGRPDISVRHVPYDLNDAVIDLCNRLIAHQAFGAVISDGQPIRMAALPLGGTITHGGHHDDPDFNNVHIEVTLNI